MRISQAARDARKKVQLARLGAKATQDSETYARMFASQPSEIAKKKRLEAARASFRMAKYAIQDALIAEAGAGVAAFSTGSMSTVAASQEPAT